MNSDGTITSVGESNSPSPSEMTVYLVKTDDIGNIIWEKYINNTNSEGCYIIKPTNDGGYVLSDIPSQIKLSNIFSAVQEEVKTVQCKKESKKGCNGKLSKCITHNLWDELELHIQYFFNKKNLGDLIKDKNENRI